MKYIITLFALLVFYSATAEVTVQIKNDSIENKITQLDKKVNSIENNYSGNIIQQYKDLNNLYSIGFTILISLFGAIFPLMFYFFQFKPAHEALKEAKLLLKKIDEDFEQSFEEHQRKNISRIIDESIDSFERIEEQQLPTALLNLQNYKSEIFSKNQILRLLNLLKREDYNDANKEPFASFLAFQKADEIENYFVDLLSNSPQTPLSIHGAIYFANNNKTEYLDLIADLVLNGYYFYNLIYKLLERNKTYCIEFLNNEKLIENLIDEDLEFLFSSLERNNYYNLQLSKLRKTALWIKYNSIKNETT